jgi:hypothetical protein
MLKYIEAPDFHFAPEWADVSRACGEAVAKAAEDNGVDFIVLPGDLHNRAMFASDKGGTNTLRDIVKSWLKICPVAAVEGTPSHDAPGSYADLEDIGLVLLRPGKMYGFYQSADRSIIEIIDPNAGCMNPDALLFGVPELSNREIVAQFGLSADQAHAEAVKYFERYIQEFIAPRRAQFPDIPAIGVLHGVVSDSAQENSSDRIVRASDIVIKTDMLALAGLDRWSLGHFHRPQEFTGCCAGYSGFTGIDDTPWNQTGFVPAMNLVEIISAGGIDSNGNHDPHISITRLPYGTPRRVKITSFRWNYIEYELRHDIVSCLIKSAYEKEETELLCNEIPDYAVWLDTDDIKIELPKDDKHLPEFHPWSRVTHHAAAAPTVRVTAEAFQAAQTLPELAKLFDPALPASVVEKLKLIEAKIIPPPREAIDVAVDWVEATDSIFWPGKTMRFTISELERGLTALLGANGDGKSALLSFCTPYPAIVGKDTDSGRQSAIKDFFTGPNAQFKKHVTLNGVKHEHIINIKGAHTKTAKVECTLSIAGKQQLDRGTWDEMFLECEKQYGPFADYLLTTFYVQPQQGKYNSGLMNATMTDIRDLVQSIAGIDRENEKRFALDEKARCEKEIEKKTNWIAGAEENVEDEGILTRSVEDKKEMLDAKISEQTAIIDNGKISRSKLDQLTEAKRANDREIDRRKSDAEKRTQLSAQIEAATQDIEKQKVLAAKESELHATLKKQQERDRLTTENATLKNAYDSLVLAYQRGNIKLESIESQIKTLDKKCPQCGYIDPDAFEKIKALEAERQTIKNPIPAPPLYSIIAPVSGTVAQTLASLTAAMGAQAKIDSFNKEIEAGRSTLATLTVIKYIIDDQIDASYTRAQIEVDRLTREYTDIKSAIATLEAEIKSLSGRIATAQDTRARIAAEREAIAVTQTELADWTYAAGLFQANKLPAFELDQIIGGIDEAAARNISPYREARYSFRSPTQQEGQKGLIDKFDILVHDNETGIEKSFLKYSPGEKAFLNDAYVKALITARNNRAHRIYSPIISDEADGPVQPDMIPAYYAMQTAFYTGKERVLVVSHAPDAHNYVQNHVAVKELLS